MHHNYICMCCLQLATAQQQAFDSACGSIPPGPATTDDDTSSADCVAAVGRLANAPARCTSTSDTDAVCSGECRGFYDDVLANCPNDVSSKITGLSM